MTHSQRTIILSAAVFSAAVCFGQAPPPPPLAPVAADSIRIVSGQFNLAGPVVKGQPYTADAVTETTQTLSDGNHISRKETAGVARDAEGRTRREQVLGAIGPWATSSSSSPSKIVFINDPVAQVDYVLEPDHTAHKMAGPPSKGGQNFVYAKMKAESEATSAANTTVIRTDGFFAGPAGPATVSISGSAPAPDEASKTEDLGSQTIEGVQAQGTRITTMIPAGQIGNELPIDIVSERWYSPELQTTIMSKFSDPRMGETIFRLTNIQRTEPPASLFEVPADYKIEDARDVKAAREAMQRIEIKETN